MNLSYHPSIYSVAPIVILEESPHSYQSLFEIEKLLREQFRQLFKKCTGKLSEMAKLEKNTWQRLDDERENYESMRKTVENSAQAKVVGGLRIHFHPKYL